MSYETQIIEMFLKDGANPNIIVDDVSPLHKAVYSENIKLVEMLLDNGANPNINPNIEGETWNRTPLNHAFETLNIPIIKLLLERGANPNDNDDETNLSWIFEDLETYEQKFAATKLLLEYGYKLYNFDYGSFINIKDYEIEIAKLLLEYVKDPNIKNKALLSAAKTNQIEMVRLLLDNGTDPNTTDTYNKDTPLMYAIEEKNLSMMILLLDRGADPHHVWEDDYHKYNMLQLAKLQRFHNGLRYLETYISEKEIEQNTIQRLATGKALDPRLGQESVLGYIDEPSIFEKIASHIPEYNRYAPDVGRRMLSEKEQTGKGKHGNGKHGKGKHGKKHKTIKRNYTNLPLN